MFALANPSRAAAGRGGRGRLVAVLLLGTASLVGGLPQGVAFAQIDDAQRVAGQMATGTQGWQQGLRDYLDKAGGDSGAVVDRARDVFSSYNQNCAGGGVGCTGDTVRQAAQLASATACAAQVVPVTISDNYVPPRGSAGYVFQPVGVRPPDGFRPVVPGDPRLEGGDKYVVDGTKGKLAGDGLSDVKRFRAEAPGNGEYRLILMGPSGAGPLSNPFGGQIAINGRPIDVTLGSGAKGATIGKSPDGVRMSVAGKGDAAMLVIDLTISSKEFDIQFLNDATVSGLILEPQNGISALGPNVGNANYGNNTNSEQCSTAESQIQQAANDGNVPPPTNPPTPPAPNPPPPVVSGN